MDKLVNNSDYISDEVLNSNHKKSLEKAVKLFREKKRLTRRYHNLLIEAIDKCIHILSTGKWHEIHFLSKAEQNRTGHETNGT